MLNNVFKVCIIKTETHTTILTFRFYEDPKTIIIFNFYWVIFGVLYVVKLKLVLEFLLARFGQVFFVGVPKCLPDSNFHLPRAIGQALMSHPK